MHEDDEWLELFANLPTLVADELEAFNDAKWSIQAYFDAKPDTHDIALLETRLNAKAVVEQLPDGLADAEPEQHRPGPCRALLCSYVDE